ncbi:MAG TPA: histidine triad nucleotide-binding protein [Leucothrix mucor]|uniref:Histidine triad nucleotide-binding protein n=1 Tax=Leucothrix mucor TaxID=45248 RepID=A0A7V2T076_LEUMU|nr:histidine triad nucleotide-binding protein [Leucothrix mucor]
MSDCIFCKIIGGEIASNAIYEDNDVFAFEDLNPQAPLHALIIPKKHIATINDLDKGNADVISKLYLTAKKVATDAGYSANGYRVVMNCGESAGQTVFHIHLHLLAGRPLKWPPG